MHYRTYHDTHKQWSEIAKKAVRQAYRDNIWPHVAESKYQVALGFQRGKSTKRCDIDGLSLLGKWCMDVLVECTALPEDNIQYVTEFRCVYLGHSEDGQEHVILQLTKESQNDSERTSIERSEDRKDEQGTVGSSEECKLQGDEPDHMDSSR